MLAIAFVLVLLVSARAQASSGAFVRPVPGRVTSGFGPRRHPVTGEENSFHNGADYAAPVGTPVRAPAAGKIVRVWSDATNGNALRLVAGDLEFGFAHLSETLVDVGDVVDAGDELARSGATGRVSGPHLHLTVRRSGDEIDPESLSWTSSPAPAV